MTPQDAVEIAWWLKAMMYAALASFGGLMGALLRAQHDDKLFSWKKILIEAVAAGFVGVLVMFACNELNLSEKWTGVIVGVCGWLGANASIVMLEKLVYSKMGITKGPGATQDVQIPHNDSK